MSVRVFEKMLGATLVKADGEEFVTDAGDVHRFYHVQDCCEAVYIESVDGDYADLLGSPLLQAEEVESESRETDCGCEDWTFYKFATVKGSVTVRWLGSSNGYYSTSVSYEFVPKAVEP
jgi:hypothetical protein